MEYKIAKEYTNLPGGRYKKDGDFSGEDFRDTILIKLIEECLKKSDELIINLDGAYGFPPSFLEEAFGGLIRKYDYDGLELKKVLKFVAKDEPKLIMDIFSYIEDAEKQKRG